MRHLRCDIDQWLCGLVYKERIALWLAWDRVRISEVASEVLLTTLATNQSNEQMIAMFERRLIFLIRVQLSLDTSMTNAAV
jgi:hypothetical protein